MSKNVELNINNIYWLNSDNLSRCASGLFKDVDDENRLAVSLASGYQSTIGPAFGVREATADEVKAAVESRAATLKTLKEAPMDDKPRELKHDGHNVAISTSDLIRIFERLYVDAKGKIIAPKYIGVTGYRRGSAMLLANAFAAKTGQQGVTEVPCEVFSFTSKKEQFITNLAENSRKTDGARNPELRDNVGAAKRLYGLGASEADIGRAFGLKRGNAQKFAAICKLDQTFPDLKVVDRIVSGELVNAKSYTYPKVNALMKDGKSQEEVEQFLLEPVENKAKIMARPDIERMSEQCPVLLVKLAMQAILANDPTVLEDYVLKADKVNEAVKVAVA